MLISNKLHSFRNFLLQISEINGVRAVGKRCINSRYSSYLRFYGGKNCFFYRYSDFLDKIFVSLRNHYIA